MRFIFRIILSLLLNAAALFVAGKFIEGFTVTKDPEEFLFVVALMTAVHLIIRPLIKLLLTPLILLTLGLFTFVINVALLWFIDFYSPGITIEGLTALLLGTIVVSLASMLAHGLTKRRALAD